MAGAGAVAIIRTRDVRVSFCCLASAIVSIDAEDWMGIYVIIGGAVSKNYNSVASRA